MPTKGKVKEKMSPAVLTAPTPPNPYTVRQIELVHMVQLGIDVQSAPGPVAIYPLSEFVDETPLSIPINTEKYAELKAWLAAEAEENGRTLQGEVMYRLEIAMREANG
jgi:hypothetical protein